jgi:UDP-N-acetylmuramate dehydrogenase
MAAVHSQHPFDYPAAGERAGVRCAASVPMAKLTTIGVGGPASWVYYPGTMAAAAKIYSELLEGPLPVRLLGAGSNVIVVDEGVRAAVICTRELREEPQRLPGNRVRVGAGHPLPGLARWAASEGLSGLEFAEGIPGQVGGGLRMNAGAHGRWMSDVAEEVLVGEPSGEVGVREVAAADFGYRQSFLSREGLFAVGAVLRLVPDEPERITRRMRTFRDRRRASQPIRERSAGCVFANPSEEPAGALIDRLGLKEASIGGASVSGKHGNFIVNRADATASDVLALLERVRERLRAELGEPPRLEVEIWRDG